MRRHENGTLRPAWREQVMSEGLVYVDSVLRGGAPYWREAQYYSFTPAETDMLAEAATTLFAMCVEAGDHVIEANLFARMGIPEWAVPAIVGTWSEDRLGAFAPSVYGRFDLRYGGTPEMIAADPTLAVPKLLEFNADTPTSLLETAVIQWNWLLGNDAVAHRDQWNNVYDALVQAWQRNLGQWQARTGRALSTVHFAYTSADASGEDKFNTLCLADSAEAAGYRAKVLLVEDIRFRTFDGDPGDPVGGRGAPTGVFLDPEGEEIQVVFKLYPWEQLAHDSWGPAILNDTARVGGSAWVEPPYKMMWANKGLLAVLWELFGDDPGRNRYLLPAFFADQAPAMDAYADKPLLGREGGNIRLVRGGREIAAAGGPYGAEGFVRQALAELPDFAGVDGSHHPVLGVWMVDGEPAGLGIRESDGLITDNSSFFVPHCLLAAEQR